jgi:hypothetical protein
MGPQRVPCTGTTPALDAQRFLNDLGSFDFPIKVNCSKQLGKSDGGAMSLLERLHATDRMLQVVDELAREAGMTGVNEFQTRIARSDQGGDVAFLELAEMLWPEHRDLVETFYRYYFHRLSREGQWRVAYTTAGSFLDRLNPKRSVDMPLGWLR